MKLKYETTEKVMKEVEIEEGSRVAYPFSPTYMVEAIVLGVIGNAIILDVPLSPAWSNRIYSPTQLMSYKDITITPPSHD